MLELEGGKTDHNADYAHDQHCPCDHLPHLDVDHLPVTELVCVDLLNLLNGDLRIIVFLHVHLAMREDTLVQAQVVDADQQKVDCHGDADLPVEGKREDNT